MIELEVGLDGQSLKPRMMVLSLEEQSAEGQLLQGQHQMVIRYG